MIKKRFPIFLTAALMPFLCACAGNSSPEKLVGKLQSALDQGDLQALLTLAEPDRTMESPVPAGAPLFPFNILLELAPHCHFTYQCTVSLKPVEDADKARWKKVESEQGGVFAVAPMGILAVKGKGRIDPKKVLSTDMPIAQQDGSWRILIARYTPEKLAELRKLTTQDRFDELVAGLKLDLSQMQALPADGGKAGDWLRETIRARSAAIAAKDVTALAASMNDEWKVHAHNLQAETSEGSAIPLVVRQQYLQIYAIGATQQMRILGGYIQEDATFSEAYLIGEGKNGAGQSLKGAVRLYKRTNEDWKIGSEFMWEVP
jgi:hypothetical protein